MGCGDESWQAENVIVLNKVQVETSFGKRLKR